MNSNNGGAGLNASSALSHDSHLKAGGISGDERPEKQIRYHAEEDNLPDGSMDGRNGILRYPRHVTAGT